MKKIKVLYVISSLKPCGPDNVMIDIIRNLSKKIFDINVLVLSDYSGDDSLSKILKNMGVRCYSLGLTRLEYFFLGKKRILHMIYMIKPDIIHTHCIRSTILVGFLGKINSKKCVTIHNYPHLDYVYGYGKIIGTISGRMILRAIDKFDLKISCSKSIEKELETKFSLETISIQNGVADNQFLDEDKVAIRKRLGLPIEKKIIISVGSISNRKNTIFLVNSLKYLRDSDVFIIFLGEGKEFEFCKKNAAENMRFLGNKSNVAEYLVASDIYVSASKAEGLPLSVLEALNAGLPVILSDIEPHREIIECSGNNKIGYLYDISSQKDFLEKLSMLLDDEYMEFYSANSLALGREVFNSRIMGKHYEDIYLEAVRANTGEC